MEMDHSPHVAPVPGPGAPLALSPTCVCLLTAGEKKAKGLRRSVSESLRNGVDAFFSNCSQELDVVSLFKI